MTSLQRSIAFTLPALLQLHRKRPERASARRDSDPPLELGVVASGPEDVRTCVKQSEMARDNKLEERSRREATGGKGVQGHGELFMQHRCI